MIYNSRMNQFKNKTVLITGASRGIGAAIARQFASKGANVVINYASSDDQAAALVEELETLGSKAIAIKADIGSEEEVKELITKAVEVFGSLDILVNNAGIVFDIPFSEKSSDQWRRTLDVNLNGVYYVTKYAIPHLNGDGSIINISSTNGIDTYHPDSIDYDVSKAGVIMFTKAMARDLAPKNIRINAIAPGWVNTDINADLPKDYIESETAKIALGRFGNPDEIAKVACFLASGDASYMTGSIITVDGGYGGAV